MENHLTNERFSDFWQKLMYVMLVHPSPPIYAQCKTILQRD